MVLQATGTSTRWVATSTLGISGGSGYSTIENEDTPLTQFTTLNFTGDGINCVNGTGQTDCTVNAGAAAAAGGDGEIQFNTGDSLDALSTFDFDRTQGRLSVGTSSFVSSLFASSTSATTSTAIFDQMSTGGLLTLRQNGNDRLTVQNGGGIFVTAETTDIVKTTSTTTGRVRPYDFLGTAGSSATNTSVISDAVVIEDGIIPNGGLGTVIATTTTTATAVGAGGQVILRDDGKYLIVHGGGSLTATVWNGTTTGALATTQTIAATTGPGAGAVILKRTDGRYQIFPGGGGAAAATSIFDPLSASSTVVAGAIGCPATTYATGTTAFLRDDGQYLVTCGAATTTTVFNPTTGTMTPGPNLSGADRFGQGIQILKRDNGTALILLGGNTATAYMYNQYASTTASVGTLTSVSISGAPTITKGVSIRRQDGRYLVMSGAANASFIYDPVGTGANPNGTWVSNGSNGPSAPLGDAAQAIWRQDGKYLLINGSTTALNIIDPGASSVLPTFSAQGTPLVPIGPLGPGATAFMMPDGRYAVTVGGASTSIALYDMGYVRGGEDSLVKLASYETECITNSNINDRSTLNWNTNSEGQIWFKVKMGQGACTSAYMPVNKSGDLIGATSTTDSIQIKVFFKRNLPQFLDQDWGVRKAGYTRYRRNGSDPALYDIKVDNGEAYHKTQFDLGNIASTSTASTSASGPTAVNVVNDGNGMAIALASGVGIGTTMAAGTGVGYYQGASQPHPVLSTAAGTSSLIMKRPDGKFIVITGSNTANAQLYDPDLETFIPAPSNPTAKIGPGAVAFKRPDGQFFIVLGNGTNVTNIFDPVANTFSVGPTLTGTAGKGAQLIPLPNGRTLIINGNFTASTTIYDPIQNVTIQGPQVMNQGGTISQIVGAGSLVIPNADGTYMLAAGISSENCAGNSPLGALLFDPYAMTFSSSTALVFTTTGTGYGAFAFQRSDGIWVIAKGLSLAFCAPHVVAAGLELYNPVTKRLASAGTLLSTTIGIGAHAVPRPDGTWAFYHGANIAGGFASSTMSIYVEKAGAFITNVNAPAGMVIQGPPSFTQIGQGSMSFQRDDGKFVTIAGAATTSANGFTTTMLYDAGWVSKGTYKSEQINIGTALDSNSTLVWKTNNVPGISAEVRTAASQASMGTSTARDISVSGGLINPTSGDTWFQVAFNFKRNFPSYGGIYTDVWYGGGSSNMPTPYRPIATPIVYEYKVTKDQDLINLQADGLSMFRVTSAGDVYTQVGATINTSGADLAERYKSQVPLEKGEVVSIDPQNNHGVKKTAYQYQPDMIGVVSTDPGFVTGAYTEDSYPIALVGRVPVKVSTENGMIHTGDYLTSASVPGYAMKASVSGRVLGKALESLDESKLVDCPTSSIIIPYRKCGTVMMFVSLIDFNGESVEVAMQDWKRKQNDLVLLGEANGLSVSTSSITAFENGENQFSYEDEHSKAIMDFLAELKKERENGMMAKSEIFTDKISATSEIISPKIITAMIEAKSGRFGHIDGLVINSGVVTADKVVTNSITSSNGGLVMELLSDGRLIMKRNNPTVQSSSTEILSDASSTEPVVLGDATSTIDIVSSSPSIGVDDIVISFDNSGNAYFDGEMIAKKVSTGALDVTGTAKFAGGLEVNSIGNASTSIDILSDTVFFGTPYFTSDTGGTARIKKGARSVDIEFAREYIETPIINASVVFATSTTDTEINSFFDSGVQFIITKRASTGFTILINKDASEDITFNWIALAVKDSKEFSSRTVDIDSISIDVLDDNEILTSSSTEELPLDIDEATGDTASSTNELEIDNATTTEDVEEEIEEIPPIPDVEDDDIPPIITDDLSTPPETP
jgi:hypothetical protein